MIDGVTVGHPCCGHPNCKDPLQSNRDRFCPAHQHLSRVCAIVGCCLAANPGRKTCGLSEHSAVEDVHINRGQARFQLQERLRRAQLAHPKDALANENTNISDLIDDPSMEEEFEVNAQGNPIPTTLSPTIGKKALRAQFGRKRTHNEQLIVAPCGIIVARETFYHAEAVHSVVVRQCS